MDKLPQSRFAVQPAKIDIPRSRFVRNFDLKTTFNEGELIPIFLDEVLPGDTFDLDMNSMIRTSTFIHPVMDNAYLDTFFFFVPNRIIWEHWEEFCGENKLTDWEQPVEYEIPQIKAPTGGWNSHTLADYLGIPIGVNCTVSHLPFRAYCSIVNEWFRNQNVEDGAVFNLDERTLTGVNSGDYVTNLQLGGPLFKVSRFHDYFSSALPSPQKGPAVSLSLGDSAPVLTDVAHANISSIKRAMTWSNSDGSQLSAGAYLLGLSGYLPASDVYSTTRQYLSGSDNGQASTASPVPDNLYADLSSSSVFTVNELRQAFQIQKLLEADSRGGTRYREMLKAHFGVTSPDSRFQIPEYLGGRRIPLNITQVPQTSGTTSSGDDASPQANLAAYSQTGDSSSMFTKSFTEHGYIMGLCCLRVQRTYQQGINKLWSRKKRFDFYYPEFANIGEQAILNKEIYAQGTSADDEAFGYQEAWAEYRYSPNRVTGQFRSNAPGTLDSWHYADDYSSLPVLGPDWMQEGTENLDRTIAVQSSVSDQVLANFYFKNITTRPMPVYSIPGLIDHH